MPSDSRVIVNIEALLKGLEQIKGLRQQLLSLSKIKVGGGTNGNAVRGVRDENAALRALQRQRSANLIRIERERNNALLSLQKQRSVALIKEEKDREAALRAAQKSGATSVASLQRQRSAALVAEERAKTRAQVAEETKRNKASESLQKQRSAALIAAARASENAVTSLQQRLGQVGGALRNFGVGLTSLGSALTVGLSAPFLALGIASIKSAKDLDSTLNTLRAFTGGTVAAERRLAQLIATAQKTPGLTTRLAATLDAQLRTAQVTKQTIDRVLPAIGRLNAVSNLGDPQKFAQNLVQLVTQNFEKADLKELIGQSPIAGQLIAKIFKVDSPTNSEAIRESARRLGITSVSAFIEAFSEAARQSDALANVTESIGTRFDKLTDRVQIALRPLGLAILSAIEPYVEPVARAVESIGNAFNSLSPATKTAVVGVGGIAIALGPVVYALGQFSIAAGGFVTAVGHINTLFGTATPAMVGFGTATAGSSRAILGIGAQLKTLPGLFKGVVTGATTVSAALATLSGGTLLVIGAVAAGVTLASVALYKYINAEREMVAVAGDAAKTTKERLESTRSEVAFLNTLSGGVKKTADQEKQLQAVYATLNDTAKGRLGLIQDETEKLAALREEKQRQLAGDELTRNAQARQLVENLAIAYGKQQAALAEVAAAQVKYNRATANRESADNVLALGDALKYQERAAKENFAATQKLNGADGLGGFNKELRDAQEAVASYGQVLGVGTAGTIKFAEEAFGASKDTETAKKALQGYTSATKDALPATDALTAGIDRQAQALLKMGNAAEAAAQQRDAALNAAKAVIADAAQTPGQAAEMFRFAEAFNPQFAALLKKQRQFTANQKKINELIDPPERAKRAKSVDSTLSTNRDRQAAVDKLTEAQFELEATRRRTANEAALEENEQNYRLQLIAFRTYLSNREGLLLSNLDEERDRLIRAQTRARAEAERAEADVAGKKLTDPGLNRALSEAAEARTEEKNFGAQLIELDARRLQIQKQMPREIALANEEREKTTEQLKAQLLALQGQFREAGLAEIDNEFREDFLKLETEIAELIESENGLRAAGNQLELDSLTPLRERAEEELKRLQAIKDAKIALVDVAAAEKLAGDAAEKQRTELEEIVRLREFEGASIEDTLQARVESENRLKDVLIVARKELQAIAATRPSPELEASIARITTQIAQLGKVSFSDQLERQLEKFSQSQARFDLAATDVQARVEQGLLSERGARREVNTLQQEYAQRQLIILERALKIAEAAKDENEILKIKGQIQETEKLARLTDTVGQNLNRSINDGLVDVLSSVADGMESLKDSALDFVGTFRKALLNLVSENIIESLLGPVLKPGAGQTGGTIGGYLSKILGRSPQTASRGIAAAGTVAGSAAGAAAAAALPQTAASAVSGAAASAALTAGGAAAGAALTTSGAGFAGAVAGAGAGFAASVAAAGASFAAAVTASQASSAALGAVAKRGGLLSGREFLRRSRGGPVVPVRLSNREGLAPPSVVRKFGADVFHSINRLKGSGTPTSDSIRTMLAPGSFVVNARAMDALEAQVQTLPAPRMAQGGMLRAVPTAALEGSGAWSGGGPHETRIRAIFVDDQSAIKNWATSAEGERVFIQTIMRNQSTVRRIIE